MKRFWHWTAVWCLCTAAATARAQQPAVPATPNKAASAGPPAAFQADIASPSLLYQLIAAALRTHDRIPLRWQRQARWRHALPDVRIQATAVKERDESLDRDQEHPDAWSADSDRDFRLQITAYWYLSDLLYDPDQLRVAQERSRQREDDRKLVRLVCDLYVQWRAASARLRYDPPEDPAAAAELRAQRAALRAQLDALTDNTLSRNLGR